MSKPEKGSRPLHTIKQAIDFLESLILTDSRPYSWRAQHPQQNIYRLLDRVGNPHHRLRVVHIAGSKGKGSTALLTEAVLLAARLRTGTFTSPHLQSWNERFRIDGHAVDDQAFIAMLEYLRPHIEFLRSHDPVNPPSFFDAATAAALVLFQWADVDYAIMEVGLGGRLDATNIVQPAVTCITSIELEHTDKLGTTLSAIAREKAGIIKPGIPVVTGTLPQPAEQVIHAYAKIQRAPLIRLGTELQLTTNVGENFTMALSIDSGNGNIKATLPVLGHHLAENAALAVACVQCLGVLNDAALTTAVQRGFATAHLPGRLEILSQNPWIVVDTAHTPASAQALASVLRTLPVQNIHWVFSFSSGKDVKAICAPLLAGNETVTVTQADPIRSRHPDSIADEIRTAYPVLDLQVVTNPVLAVQEAYWNLTSETALCITGSVYIAGIAKSVLTGIIQTFPTPLPPY